MSAFCSSMNFPILINIVIILMCNLRKIVPWDNIKIDFYRFFMDFASLKLSASGLFGFIVIVSTSAFALYQYYLIYQHETDYEALCQRSGKVHTKVLGVTEYFQETDNFFKKLECKSMEVKGKYKTLETVNTIRLFNKLQEDIAYIRTCWEKEIVAFNYFGIDMNGSLMTEANIRAQLTMAKGYIGMELRKIEKNMAEDRLSLCEVERDVSGLQKHFGRVEL